MYYYAPQMHLNMLHDAHTQNIKMDPVPVSLQHKIKMGVKGGHVSLAEKE